MNNYAMLIDYFDLSYLSNRDDTIFVAKVPYKKFDIITKDILKKQRLFIQIIIIPN